MFDLPLFRGIKVRRQTCDTWLATKDGTTYQGRSYGGWRYWCGFCLAYEWAGRDIAESMDYARAHCAAAHSQEAA